MNTSTVTPRAEGPNEEKSTVTSRAEGCKEKKSTVTPRAGPRSEGADSAAAASTSVKQEATPLTMLNARTASLSSWVVAIASPRVDEIEYQWEGKARKSQVFTCILVSTDNNESYCLGEVRKEYGQPHKVQEAQEKYKEGRSFRMSKVTLSTKSKPEYNHCTHKVAVNMAKTKMEPLLQSIPHAPQPVIQCCDCVALKSFQAFDITALIQSISDRRAVSSNRYVREVVLADGTAGSVTSPAEKAALVQAKIEIYYTATTVDDPAFMQEISRSIGQPKPFHFFNLQARMTENGWKCNTGRWYYIAPAQGPRATKLIQQHETIQRDSVEKGTRTLEIVWLPEGGDQADTLLKETPGQETICAHLADMSKVTGLSALDEKTTVWQVNWVFPTITRDSMLTKAGNKLWLNIVLEDSSGSASARMGEATALALSQHPDKEMFIQSIEDGDTVFPTVLSVKVARKVRRAADEEESESTVRKFVSLQIITAEPQPFNHARTQTALQLLPILRSFSGAAVAILPVAMFMLVPSNLYHLLVQYPVNDVEPQPCSKVWLLIKTSRKSYCTDEPPYMVTTEGIQEGLTMHGSVQPPTSREYKLVSMCNKNNRSSFQLTPKHGKEAYALAVIASIDGDNLFAESVEPLMEDERKSLEVTMLQEMNLAIL